MYLNADMRLIFLSSIHSKHEILCLVQEKLNKRQKIEMLSLFHGQLGCLFMVLETCSRNFDHCFGTSVPFD